MSEECDARIRRLEDIHEIKNLQARYAYLLDTDQEESIPDLFADTFVAEYAPEATFTTKPDLLAFLKDAGQVLSMTCHQMLNPLIEVEGDKATGTWYLFGPFTTLTPQGPVATWMQAKYNNEYVREGGKWKFSRLNFEPNIHSPYDDGWVKTRQMGA